MEKRTVGKYELTFYDDTVVIYRTEAPYKRISIDVSELDELIDLLGKAKELQIRVRELEEEVKYLEDCIRQERDIAGVEVSKMAEEIGYWRQKYRTALNERKEA